MSRASAALLLLSVAGAAAADDCEHRAERNLDLDAAGITVLELRAAAGDLEIRGDAGLDRIVVRGTACASNADLLADMQLLERREGDRQSIAVEMPEVTEGWLWNTVYRYLDLDVRVPARLMLDVVDSSGDTSVRDVASLTLKDSSGDLAIGGIEAGVELRDSSGDIEVREVGALTIVSDSSGDIEVANVAGDVLIEDDSSGDIEIADVRGGARVVSDSSGDIRFERVTGSAEVGSDSSGGIRAVRIGGDFRVGRDGSGGIAHEDVAGVVDIPEDD